MENEGRVNREVEEVAPICVMRGCMICTAP
jgi:hypothetical protein